MPVGLRLAPDAGLLRGGIALGGVKLDCHGRARWRIRDSMCTHRYGAVQAGAYPRYADAAMQHPAAYNHPTDPRPHPTRTTNGPAPPPREPQPHGPRPPPPPQQNPRSKQPEPQRPPTTPHDYTAKPLASTS